ncbi:metallophosphoesterase [Novosphingobium sp. 9]|uniref:metallophosphoesterase n=1 Tax=Novosphingobium sp. 9 TaxID=2025349 RepID=UPI0021B5BAD7|nr:metallophosphoesterase [Novosphingobium sp. 9]
MHGRLDLLDTLISAIESDDASRPSAHVSVVMLGDLVDRGPDSAGVLRKVREWSTQRSLVLIKGNHEEQMIRARDDLDALRMFLKFGGFETLRSYGVPQALLDGGDLEDIQRAMCIAIPDEDFAFIDGFRNSNAIGGYFFVHAGIRPGVPLERQMAQDCRWIREPFLSHRGDFGAVIVHGHTIFEEPDFRPNRIGIDTGSYVHGRLTALGLQGSERWLIQASETAEGPVEAALLPA